jgi:hypothetical protein
MSDRVDRTLSEDPTSTIWVESGSVYHELGMADPAIADCKIIGGGTDGAVIGTETEAIEDGPGERCSRCSFDSPLVLYATAAKEYHRRVEAGGVAASDCQAIETAARDEVLARSAETLEHNGIERCGDCDWSGQS